MMTNRILNYLEKRLKYLERQITVKNIKNLLEEVAPEQLKQLLENKKDSLGFENERKN